MDDDYADTFMNLFVDYPDIEGVLFNDKEEQVNWRGGWCWLINLLVEDAADLKIMFLLFC